MKILIVLAAVLAAAVVITEAVTNVKCVVKPAYWKCGARSGTRDDDSAYQHCDKGFQIRACACKSYGGRDDCDGARWEMRRWGETCRAYNSYGGKGVQACAYCQQLVMTCATPMMNQPRIRCPQHYKMSGCSMHADHRHNLWVGSGKTRHPEGTQKAGTCMTNAGCTKCRAVARCVHHDVY